MIVQVLDWLQVLSIAGPLFTAVLCHGYMPKCIRVGMLVPTPKNNKDPSSSKNYREIAIAPLLSYKALELNILSNMNPTLQLVLYNLASKKVKLFAQDS